MMVLLFVLLPMLVVTCYALATWWRNRQPSSIESGVDAFQREMSALSPDAAPVQRRPERPAPSGDRPAPRRPQGGPNDPPKAPR